MYSTLRPHAQKIVIDIRDT